MYLFLQPIHFQAWLAADCAKTSGVHKISPPFPFMRSTIWSLLPAPYFICSILSGQKFGSKGVLCMRKNCSARGTLVTVKPDISLDWKYNYDL